MSAPLAIRMLKRGPIPKSGPVLFAVMRDERYLLPHFLRHYRALGLESFVIYADRCAPDVLETLIGQPDTTVLTSPHRFADVVSRGRSGNHRTFVVTLKTQIVERLLPGRWVLLVDADEFLVLPPPLATLPDLVRLLEVERQPWCWTPMVDMYPPTLAGRAFDGAPDPFAGAPLFDAGPYHDWRPPAVMPAVLRAGVLGRIVGAVASRHPAEFALACGGDRLGAARTWKVPLLRHGLGYHRIGHHSISVTPVGRVAAALAHFKLYPDLDAKIATAVEEGQYHGRSIQYRVLDLALAKLADMPLACDRTRRYAGPADLVAAGLLPDVG